MELRAKQDYDTINKISINAKKAKEAKEKFKKEQERKMNSLFKKNKNNFKETSNHLKKYNIDRRINPQAVINSRTSPIPASSSDDEFNFEDVFKGGGKKLSITDYKKF